MTPLAKAGRQLDSAVSAYNEAVGSFDTRVMPQVRRIEQAGAASEREVARRRALEITARAIASARRSPRPRRGPLPAVGEPPETASGSPPAPEFEHDQGSATGTVAGSSSHEEEQQVEDEREHGP